MKSRNKKNIFNYKVNTNPTFVSLSTETFFNKLYKDSNESPIDKFYLNANSFNRLIGYLSSNTSINADLISNFYNLVLLGYVSSVESYYREIIRRLINIDEISSQCCESKELSFGAAISNSKELLAEALLEHTMFISKKNITDSIREYAGYKGNFPDEFDSALIQYEIICHLRHCIVHRFGKLGSNNAIKFGLQNHKEIIEKPIQLDQNKIYNCSIICTNIVLVTNDFLFNYILKRAAESNKWTWDLRKDKNEFTKYFNLFNSIHYPSATKSNIKDSYNELRKYIKSIKQN